jgi:ubiquinone biosynthesis protein COQ9
MEKQSPAPTNKNQDIRDRILLAALEDVAFDGWHWPVIEGAAEKAGFGKDMAFAVFPDKREDVIGHFSDWADRQMLSQLADEDYSGARIRDKIEAAVWTRLNILTPHREATRQAAAFWSRPLQGRDGGRALWQTADRIWEWAGDTATDYNHYTKRALLSGVILSTTLRWFNDQTEGSAASRAFLKRRIDNVLTVGQKSGKLIGQVSKLTANFPLRRKKR